MWSLVLQRAGLFFFLNALEALEGRVTDGSWSLGSELFILGLFSLSLLPLQHLPTTSLILLSWQTVVRKRTGLIIALV